ncbi:MAG: peptidase M3 [Flavobacteriales bacterium CG_4_9_14_3_um_filter_40_17]|nr:MAG: peptidase M3 [Flavobacteriales bacterium CG_4_9_14_3_um_filter_40_17]
MTQNPLLKPFETTPFASLKTEHFLPAVQQEIANTQKEIDAIIENPQEPTFENTIEALDYSGKQLDRITSIFYNLNSAETTPEIQKLAQEISPLLTAFSNDIALNQALFERVKKVNAQKEKLKLTAEQKTLLDKKYKSFARNGANLTEEKKEILRQLDSELSKLSLQFGENVLAETQAYQLHITDVSKLKGLPESALEAAQQLAEKQNLKGYVFTLDFPSYQPFMTYVENRDLRKELFLAYATRAYQKAQHDNREIVLQIVRKRHERAQLLGYKTHAHYVLEERMAQSPEKAKDFLNELLKKSKQKAQEEFQQLKKFAKESGDIERLEKWDAAFYTEKLKQKLYDFDDEQLKPYFVLGHVLQGVFTVANRLYQLHFEEVYDIDKYCEEVKTFRITDDKNNLIAIFYADFHPRPGKRNGAWMTSYKPQYRKGNTHERPHISIVCNFSRPTKTKPSLLTFNEVTTLFHEFGHALHGMLANTVYPSLSGTHVYWDFVELPSQVLENWCYEKEALELFAKHYQTGEILPLSYIEKIKKAATFMQGLQTLRQLSFGLLDLKWHAENPEHFSDLKTIEKTVFSETDFYPEVAESCMSTAFSHIFQGGYSAGYYSYKWAEVLDADAFELFKEKGVFDAETAKSFKENILSKGGSEHPMVLYKRFRGAEPNPDALLRRAGISN